jgi:ketosteroid isomerase-like protein
MPYDGVAMPPDLGWAGVLTAWWGAKTMVRHVDPKEDQMAHPNENLVREGIAAFQRGDLDALQHQFFAEDIRYHVPGRSPVAGDYQGAAQVIELYGRLFELSGGTLRVELHDVVANDEHAASLITLRAERAGKQLEDNTVQTFHIRDGKATEIWTHTTDLYAVDEFWS